MARREGYSLGLYEKAIPQGTSFQEKLDIARQCGFDRLEISIDESDQRLERLNWSPARQYELRRLTEDAGVTIRTMCLSAHRKYPMGSHDQQVRERSMEILRGAVDFCQRTGISIIQLAGYDVYYEESDETTRRFFAENLKAAVETAAKQGVILAFETMETPFMDTVTKAMDYVSMVGSPWLGVYPDIGNLKNASLLYGHDTAEEMKAGAGHIFALHLKETQPGVYRDLRFGTGHTEYEPCIQAAVRMGVRLFTGEFWHHEGEDHLAEIRRANQFLRERIEKAL